ILYYEGTVVDITERKRAERRLAAQYAVASLLAEAATLGESAPQILQTICESVDWEMGTLWSVDRQAEAVRCVDVWHRPGLEAEPFVARTRAMLFYPDIGLPGRVWARRKSVWLPDVLNDSNFPRASDAARAGLHGAFAFPILFGSEVTGVI